AKLKQICNHPATVIDDPTASLAGRSGKVDRLAELLAEIVDEGSAAVVFSQYPTFMTRIAAHLDRRAPTVRELAVISAALMGPGIAVADRYRRSQARVDAVIAGIAFHPVYQPIAEVLTRRVMGYEALTRFSDGRRPDEAFEAARNAGRGLELEVATLDVAIAGAVTIDPACYLSLNISPELASSAELLGPVLRRVDRHVVLEITEHVPVHDYERLLATLYALDLKVRLAVDDAGAGYAGLQHILAIRPQLIKLDTSLVRSVDTDIARQALIEGMASFSARIGAVLVAEGVETEPEAAMLATLGVGLMQGYLVGRPLRASEMDPGLLQPA
ncbi:MAG: EAL domain-containing protein, partial [Chloroflexota bacterium]